jgi:type IV pilus assembly protein PilB
MSATLPIYQERSFSEILVEEGLIAASDLGQILGRRDDSTEPIGDLLIRLGVINEKDKARCIGKQIGVPFVDLARRELDPNVVRLIPHRIAQRLHALPIERSDTAVSVAMLNPLDITAIDELQAHMGLAVDPCIAGEEDIREAVFRAFGAYDDLGELVGEAVRGIDPNDIKLDSDAVEPETEVSFHQLKEMSEGAPVVRLVNAIITRAIACRASDIHVEPERHRVRIRFRVDGVLQEAMIMPKDLQYAFLSRIKIIASMDIAERRLPQDGRLTLRTPQGEFDFRLSTFPSLYGENLVIRILDRNAGRIGLRDLGLQADMFACIQSLISLPHGMILTCGPTGSGKTTTLYACINMLNSVERNIMTVEDPVEYQVAGIIQGNVNVKAGITFATGLRTLVRQDPDVILVGEIRDGETARIAVEAALTGHLVLSTIHSNDAASAITRLIDMGVEPFLVSSALVAALAQRLVRVICPRCAARYAPSPLHLETLGCQDLAERDDFDFRRGVGCDHCSRSGYKGRTGVYELLEVTEEIQRLIVARASSRDIRSAALTTNRSLRDDAVMKIRDGITTVEEVVRTTVA